MSEALERTPLGTQLAQKLRGRILRGDYGGRLPAERELSARLQVGRNTLRAALDMLAAEGLVERRRGSGTHVTHAASATHAASSIDPANAGKHGDGVTSIAPVASVVPASLIAPAALAGRVCLLLPEHPEGLQPLKLLWLDALRLVLLERGLTLRIEVVRARRQSSLVRSLEQIVSSAGVVDCWVLALCQRSTQLWFQEQGLACVLAGSAHDGVTLPSLDCDFYALGRHAAGRMLGGGHSSLAYFSRKSSYAGDAECLRGFGEAVQAHRTPPRARWRQYLHDGTPGAVACAAAKMLRCKPAVSACFVDNGYDYLTLSGWLAQRGVRVGQDISLVCRSDEPFLAHLLPVPDRYVTTPKAFARSLCALIWRRCCLPDVSRSLFQARFVKGESFCPPAS